MSRNRPAASSPLLALVAALAAALVATGLLPAPVHAADPRHQRGLYVDRSMPAARQGSAYSSIAKRSQALWLTDADAVGKVRGIAHAYAARAVKAGRTPVVTVYAIPDRDCGGYSSGGLANASAYARWIGKVAAGLEGSHALVVLEPDALPSIGDCSGQGNRSKMIAAATRRLTKAGAWVYLDAGHDDWQPAAVMAARLKSAGVAGARGFSLNVSNFRPTGAEESYARKILAALRTRGVRNRHYVVDTSRNGAAATVSGDVCNPTWARLGASPKLVFQGAFDGRLWVKHPGESDGSCNGGPPAGQWCDLLADRLLGRDPQGETCS